MNCKYVFLTIILSLNNFLSCIDWSNLSEQQIRYILGQLPGSSQRNPVHTKSDMPGGERWNPLYVAPAERTAAQEFMEVIRDSDKLRDQFRESSQELAAWMFQSRDQWQVFKDVAYAGAVIATIPAISYLTIKGGGAVVDVIRYKMTTPRVEIIEKEAGPIYGRWDRIARWWSGYQMPSVVFDQLVKAYLEEIQEKTKNIKDHIRGGDKSVTYANLLLYGPPGTGKTMFAKLLADYTNMDFIPVTAASLMQDPVAFSNIVEMANRSSYGAIIFIDEADALFLNRNELLKSTAPDALAQYKALNHILAIIGQRNNRYMIVAATNFPHVMDEAMNSRFPEKVAMPLPDLSTRFALIKLYVEKALFNEKLNSKEFIKVARSLFFDASIQELAVRLDGFAPREINNLIEGIRNATYGTKDRMITKEIVVNAINRALVSHKAFAKPVAMEAQEMPMQEMTPA